MTMPETADWSSGMADHRRSIETFVSVARAIPATDWNTPLAADKWSPAQTVEHVRLVYEVLGRELAGGQGLVIRTKWWQRAVLRFKILPNILAHGKIPARAPAPREARPGPGPFEKEPLLEALTDASAAMARTLAERRDTPGAAVTHHIFGRLTLPQIVRFGTVHNDHHTRQLQRS